MRQESKLAKFQFMRRKWRTIESNYRTSILLITDSLMMGAIPIPLGEKRNSILPSVATGHQSEKREEMGQATNSLLPLPLLVAE